MNENQTCSEGIPRAVDLFKFAPVPVIASLFISVGLATAIIIVFFESVLHVLRKLGSRNRTFVLTLWMLSIYPVYAVSGVWALIIPRSGTLVDFVANVYFSVCLYQFVQLMITYAGGRENILAALEDNTHFSLRGPPCCCCCIFLPTVRLNRKKWTLLLCLVLQVIVIRPSLMFIAAVLWTDNSYEPGVVSIIKDRTYDNISPTSAYTYITILDITSSMFALYGLLLFQMILMPLLHAHSIQGKFFSLQLVLISTSLTNLIIGILVGTNVIPCGKYLPSKARGQVIYHYCLVLYMLPLSLLARSLYRNGDEYKIKINNEDDEGNTNIHNISSSSCGIPNALSSDNVEVSNTLESNDTKISNVIV